ncbi:hypothetical protein PHMEG_00036349 [Phytophthora megakarya]|uniref:Uncharacterized protein n=1 Tax=Phytophthora megakarya TaxID=4795 RepID=A0A225UM79_9STRA|nr:hypothetical protein PHMEG_00036349 [Phytophthora megakarya]
MATAILHFHDMLQLAPAAPYIKRLETWALTIRTDIIHQKEQKRCSSPTISTHNSGDVATQKAELIERQTRVIESLAQQVRSLNQRVLALEDPRVKAPSSMRDDNRTESNSAAIGVCKPASDRRSGAKAPSSVWYELFSDLKGQQQKDRRRYHEAKLAVVYMRIYLPRGYDTGLEAGSNLIDFLNGQGIKAKAIGTVVKALKGLHAQGKLNEHIMAYRHLQANGLIIDPSPKATVHELHEKP